MNVKLGHSILLEMKTELSIQFYDIYTQSRTSTTIYSDDYFTATKLLYCAVRYSDKNGILLALTLTTRLTNKTHVCKATRHNNLPYR